MTVSARLRARPASRPAAGRRVECHCCVAVFATAKPHDPERDQGFGTCDGCRDYVADSWTRFGFAGKVYTFTEAITRLTRYA